jgi:hypothetical protein
MERNIRLTRDDIIIEIEIEIEIEVIPSLSKQRTR